MRITTSHTRCRHIPTCPQASAPDHAAARIVADHTDQGWSLLCNGVVLFTDHGEILPSGQAVPAERSVAHRTLVAA